MLVVIRGAGDIASGIALRLYRAGMQVVMCDLAVPTSIRRTVCFSEAIRLGDIMSSAWINFARTGNPNGEGVPQWPAYTPDKKATMLFDTECEVRYGFDAALQEVVARKR